MKFLATHAADSEYTKWFFERLERLASYMYVCAIDVNNRIERYACVLTAMESAHSMATPVSAIELNDDEKRHFVSVLQGNIYSMMARRRNYLILRLDAFLSDGAAKYDPSLLTLEHVLPQTVSPGSQWATWWPNIDDQVSWVHRLANLVPLNRRRNSQAQNFDFDKKKTAYFVGKQGVSSYVLTTQVLQKATWTPADIQSRQNDLIDVLSKQWRLEV